MLSLRNMRARATSMPRDVLVLTMVAFSVAVGFGVLVPVLPVFAKHFGVSNFAAAAVVSAFAVMRLVTSPFVGRIINTLGTRTTMVTGILIVAVSSTLAGFAQTYSWLLIMRGLGGIGSAMFTVSAMTLLLAAAPPDKRGRAVGTFQSGFLLGGMAGPALGALVASIHITAPFHFYAVMLLVAGTVALILLRSHGGTVEEDHTEPPRPLREVLRDARFQAACLAGASQGWNTMGMRNSLTPVFVVEVLDRGPAWTGIAFASGAIVQTIALQPVGRIVDQVGRRPVMIAGSLVAGLCLIAVPFTTSVWVFIPIMALYGIGAACLGTAPAASVGDAAGGKGGTPVAIFSMFTDLGAILGPLVAGFLADQTTWPIAFSAGTILFAVVILLSLRMPPGRPTAATERSTPLE